MNDAARSMTRQDAALEESRWVDRARAGDESAVSLLIHRHRARVLRVAGNVLRDVNEAEDVAQDAFLKAFRELHRLRSDSSFGGYLYRIAVRLCMDRLRSRKHTEELLDRPVPHAGNGVETKVVVERLLQELSPEMRLTLVLREMEQLSYDEIAEATDVPVGTVRSRLHVARERFRELWIEATGRQG